MIINRRGFIAASAAGAAASVFGLKSEAAARTAAPDSFIDISKQQKQFLGEDFLNELVTNSAQKKFIFLDFHTFAPFIDVMESEGLIRPAGMVNPFNMPEATQEEKDIYTQKVWRAVDAMTRERPQLREFMQGFRDAGQIADFCMMERTMSIRQQYHQITNFFHTPLATILCVPSQGFDHQQFISRFVGLPAQQRDIIIPGTSLDWARLITAHEVGHSDEGGAPADKSDLGDDCNALLRRNGYERFADRFARRHFTAEIPEQTEEIVRTWRLCRAIHLGRGDDTNMFREGSVENIHATALDLLPDAHITMMTNAQNQGAHAAAIAMVRATHTLLDANGYFGERAWVMEPNPLILGGGHFLFPSESTHILMPPPRVPVDPAAPEEMLRHSWESAIPRSTFAAIADGLLARDAFRDMRDAREIASLFVEAVGHFRPDIVSAPAYGLLKTQVMGFPAEPIAQMAAAIRRAAEGQNFCTVTPPPAPPPFWHP